MRRIAYTAIALLLCSATPACAGFSLDGQRTNGASPAPASAAAAPQMPSGYSYNAPLGDRSIASTLPPVPVYGGAQVWNGAPPAAVTPVAAAPAAAAPAPSQAVAAAPVTTATAYSGTSTNSALLGYTAQPGATATMAPMAEPAQPMPAAQPVSAGNGLPVVGVGPVKSGAMTYPVEEDDYAVYFDFDMATLTPQSADSLLRWAAFLTWSPSTKITVEGYADDIGTDRANMKLSQQRADTVRNFLIRQGIEPSRMATTPYGEARPAIDSFYTIRPDGAYSRISRAYNRRAVIAVVGSENPDWVSNPRNWAYNRTGR